MSKYFRQVNKCLHKVRKGDRLAVDELFRLTVNHLRGVACHYLTDKSRVDDAVDETFARMLTSKESFDEKKDGYNWLCKILKNVALRFNIADAERIQQDVHIEAAADIPVADGTDSATKIDLQDAIDKLDAENKDMVYLYFYEGYTLEEVGAKYGIKKSAVKRRMDRNLEKIKNFLNPM